MLYIMCHLRVLRVTCYVLCLCVSRVFLACVAFGLFFGWRFSFLGRVRVPVDISFFTAFGILYANDLK